MSEWDDERALAAWRADQTLFADVLVYVLARAPRCGVGACKGVAHWRYTERGASMPKDVLTCDAHKRAGCVEIEGAGVVRRVLKKARGSRV